MTQTARRQHSLVHANHLAPLILVALRLACGPMAAAEIHDAAAAGDLVKVRALVEADAACVDTPDREGSTALHRACARRQTAVAQFLIEHGANVNAKNKEGYVPLIDASRGRGRDTALIEELLNRGADVNAALPRGMTALHLAAISGDIDVARTLIQHRPDLNAYDRGAYGTPLHTAINLRGDAPFVKLLAENGADVNRLFSFGNTPLHLAAALGHADVAKILIAYGADVRIANEYGRTALYYATRLGHRTLATALIAAGADKTTIDESNYGPARQLTSPPAEGEAAVWYMGGLYGGGFAVKTKNHLLVFDEFDLDTSPEAGLVNGRLNPGELAGQNITLFITKAQALSRYPQTRDLAQRMPEIDWVVDVAPTIDDTPVELPHSRLANPHESFEVDGLMVHVIPATVRGNGGTQGLAYLVEADGLKILHAGFLTSGRNKSQVERFRAEVDLLKAHAPIDIVFLTVSHLTVDYPQYRYLVEQLAPKAIHLMGGDQDTAQYPVCAKALEACGVPIVYPEAGIAAGQRFDYKRVSTDADTSTVAYAAQSLRVVHSFGGGADDGATPYGTLVQVDGALFGTTREGGARNRGTVFRIEADGSGFRILHSFASGTDDGQWPIGSLISPDGMLYGVAAGAGSNAGGTIFRIEPDGDGFEVLRRLAVSDGEWPWAALHASGSQLFGLNAFGGTSHGWRSKGTAFRMGMDGSQFQVVHAFAGGEDDGVGPHGTFVELGPRLYATTLAGGRHDLGTLFRMAPDGSDFQILHHFAGGAEDGGRPYCVSLVRSGPTFYGTTMAGGPGDMGTIFRINTDGSGFGLLHTFTGGTDGQKPFGSLIRVGPALYGMTSDEDTGTSGTIYRIQPDGSGFEVLHRFAGHDGKNPAGALFAQGRRLYGMTSQGGAHNKGVVFALDLPETIPTATVSYASATSPANSGNR